MTRNSRFLLLCSLLPTLVTAQPRTVRDGVFTAAQAKRGETLFAARCARCHEGADVDGPPLKGDPFLDRWREDTLSGLLSFLQEKMPQDAPGSLKPSEYLDVLSFILGENQIPAGPAELTAESVASVLLVGPDGPKPLPANALVRITGCLTQDAKKNWSLTQVGAPERTRTGDSATPSEVQAAAKKPLGSQSFDLGNLEDLSGFQPDSNRGHKLFVKGVLGRRGSALRVNVLYASSLSEGCP